MRRPREKSRSGRSPSATAFDYAYASPPSIASAHRSSASAASSAICLPRCASTWRAKLSHCPCSAVFPSASAMPGAAIRPSAANRTFPPEDDGDFRPGRRDRRDGARLDQFDVVDQKLGRTRRPKPHARPCGARLRRERQLLLDELPAGRADGSDRAVAGRGITAHDVVVPEADGAGQHFQLRAQRVPLLIGDRNPLLIDAHPGGSGDRLLNEGAVIGNDRRRDAAPFSPPVGQPVPVPVRLESSVLHEVDRIVRDRRVRQEIIAGVERLQDLVCACKQLPIAPCRPASSPFLVDLMKRRRCGRARNAAFAASRPPGDRHKRRRTLAEKRELSPIRSRLAIQKPLIRQLAASRVDGARKVLPNVRIHENDRQAGGDDGRLCSTDPPKGSTAAPPIMS